MSETKIIYKADGTVARQLVLHDDGSTIDVSRHNLDPILEAAKVARENQRPTSETHYRHVAVIPPHVLEQAMREGWVHDKAKWAKWLNDPQNKDFRVWNGNISGREGV